MPRTARLYYPSGVFHIISRCHAQEFLFDGDSERHQYLAQLGQTLTRTDARLLAWCIMSNHTHLVVQAGGDPLSRLTKPLNSGFAVWKNRGQGRIGAVFAGRPKSVLVESELYLLELVRYVHLNPVRAGVVDHADQSDWSSHQAYLGLTTPPPWLHTDLVMDEFNKDRNSFAEFVAESEGEPRRPDLSGELSADAGRELRRLAGPGVSLSDTILGNPEFVEKALERSGKPPTYRTALNGLPQQGERIPGLRELVATSCAIVDIEEHTFRQRPKKRPCRQARQVLTWLWVKQFHQPQVAVARYLNVGSDQVSRWLGKAIDTFDELEPLAREVLAALPAREPDLASGRPSKVNVNVEVVDD